MIRQLSKEVQSSLRTGVALTSVGQCVEELALNAVDAGATCVAVRIDLQSLTLQVVDNGVGIPLEQLPLVGERYSTSKCHTIQDMENLKYFGYRGEALASLSSLSSVLEIMSRSKGSAATYRKCFHKGRPLQISEASSPRPSFGTTVTARDMFYNLPVRKKKLVEGVELEKVRLRLAGLALVWPQISFSLRDDVTGNVILQTHKSSGLLATFTSLFGGSRSKRMREVSVTSNNFKISGLISCENYSRKDLQFVFVNKRLILKSKIHKLLNTLFSKSILVRSRGNMIEKTNNQITSDQQENVSPTKYSERYAVYVINFDCPLSTYDITFDPAKTLVEFHDWSEPTKLVEDMIQNFLREENLLLPAEQLQTLSTSESTGISESSTTCLEEWEDPFEGNSEDFDEAFHTEQQKKRYSQGISTYNSRNSLFSQTVKRPKVQLLITEDLSGLSPIIAKKYKHTNKIDGETNSCYQDSWDTSRPRYQFSCGDNHISSLEHMEGKSDSEISLTRYSRSAKKKLLPITQSQNHADLSSSDSSAFEVDSMNMYRVTASLEEDEIQHHIHTSIGMNEMDIQDVVNVEHTRINPNSMTAVGVSAKPCATSASKEIIPCATTSSTGLNRKFPSKNSPPACPVKQDSFFTSEVTDIHLQPITAPAVELKECRPPHSPLEISSVKVSHSKFSSLNRIRSVLLEDNRNLMSMECKNSRNVKFTGVDDFSANFTSKVNVTSEVKKATTEKYDETDRTSIPLKLKMPKLLKSRSVDGDQPVILRHNNYNNEQSLRARTGICSASDDIGVYYSTSDTHSSELQHHSMNCGVNKSVWTKLKHFEQLPVQSEGCGPCESKEKSENPKYITLQHLDFSSAMSEVVSHKQQTPLREIEKKKLSSEKEYVHKNAKMLTSKRHHMTASLPSQLQGSFQSRPPKLRARSQAAKLASLVRGEKSPCSTENSCRGQSKMSDQELPHHHDDNNFEIICINDSEMSRQGLMHHHAESKSHISHINDSGISGLGLNHHQHTDPNASSCINHSDMSKQDLFCHHESSNSQISLLNQRKIFIQDLSCQLTDSNHHISHMNPRKRSREHLTCQHTDSYPQISHVNQREMSRKDMANQLTDSNPLMNCLNQREMSRQDMANQLTDSNPLMNCLNQREISRQDMANQLTDSNPLMNCLSQRETYRYGPTCQHTDSSHQILSHKQQPVCIQPFNSCSFAVRENSSDLHKEFNVFPENWTTQESPRHSNVQRWTSTEFDVCRLFQTPRTVFQENEQSSRTLLEESRNTFSHDKSYKKNNPDCLILENPKPFSVTELGQSLSSSGTDLLVKERIHSVKQNNILRCENLKTTPSRKFLSNSEGTQGFHFLSSEGFEQFDENHDAIPNDSLTFGPTFFTPSKQSLSATSSIHSLGFSPCASDPLLDDAELGTAGLSSCGDSLRQLVQTEHSGHTECSRRTNLNLDEDELKALGNSKVECFSTGENTLCFKDVYIRPSKSLPCHLQIGDTDTAFIACSSASLVTEKGISNGLEKEKYKKYANAATENGISNVALEKEKYKKYSRDDSNNASNKISHSLKEESVKMALHGQINKDLFEDWRGIADAHSSTTVSDYMPRTVSQITAGRDCISSTTTVSHASRPGMLRQVGCTIIGSSPSSSGIICQNRQGSSSTWTSHHVELSLDETLSDNDIISLNKISSSCTETSRHVGFLVVDSLQSDSVINHQEKLGTSNTGTSSHVGPSVVESLLSDGVINQERQDAKKPSQYTSIQSEQYENETGHTDISTEFSSDQHNSLSLFSNNSPIPLCCHLTKEDEDFVKCDDIHKKDFLISFANESSDWIVPSYQVEFDRNFEHGLFSSKKLPDSHVNSSLSAKEQASSVKKTADHEYILSSTRKDLTCNTSEPVLLQTTSALTMMLPSMKMINMEIMDNNSNPDFGDVKGLDEIKLTEGDDKICLKHQSHVDVGSSLSDSALFGLLTPDNNSISDYGDENRLDEISSIQGAKQPKTCLEHQTPSDVCDSLPDSVLVGFITPDNNSISDFGDANRLNEIMTVEGNKQPKTFLEHQSPADICGSLSDSALVGFITPENNTSFTCNENISDGIATIPALSKPFDPERQLNALAPDSHLLVPGEGDVDKVCGASDDSAFDKVCGTSDDSAFDKVCGTSDDTAVDKVCGTSDDSAFDKVCGTSDDTAVYKVCGTSDDTAVDKVKVCGASDDSAFDKVCGTSDDTAVDKVCGTSDDPTGKALNSDANSNHLNSLGDSCISGKLSGLWKKSRIGDLRESCTVAEEVSEVEGRDIQDIDEGKRKHFRCDENRPGSWLLVKDPVTGGQVYVNNRSGHTLTPTQWDKMDIGQGQTTSVSCEAVDCRKVEPLKLSPLSCQTLHTLCTEHLEAEEEDSLAKWRDGNECISKETWSNNSTADIVSSWENPVFRNPSKILSLVEKNQNTQAGQRSHSVLHPMTFTKAMLSGAKVLGQVDNKFIACLIREDNSLLPSEEGGLLVLFDQHAAHERVRLEQLMSTLYEKNDNEEVKKIRKSCVDPPRKVTLPEGDVRLMQSFREEFERVGIVFEVDEQCHDTVHVHTIPACMAQREANDRKRGKDPLIFEYLERMIHEHCELLILTAGARLQLPKAVHRLLATQACKGAVKFGDKLSISTCQELLLSLASCDLPFQCVHGRPSIAPLLNLRQFSAASSETKHCPSLFKLRARMQMAEQNHRTGTE